MRRVFVVVDTDNAKGLKAFLNEARADSWAYDYYEKNGIDTRVDEVWFDEQGDPEDEP